MEAGDVDAVRKALWWGADVNMRSPSGTTALGMALAKRRDDIATLLREAGARE